MAEFATKSQPHSAPPSTFVDFEIVDFRVVDPGAPDPNAAVFTLRPSQPFTFVVKVKGTGSIWTGSNLDTRPTWQTRFFADALALDVVGERSFGPVIGPLTLDTPPNIYSVQLSVPTGLPAEGVYELGALVRLPANGIHGFASEYHIDIAAG